MNPLSLAPWLLLALVILVAVAVGGGYRAVGIATAPKRWHWLVTILTTAEPVSGGVAYSDDLWMITLSGVAGSKAEAVGSMAGQIQNQVKNGAAVMTHGLWSES